VSAEPLAGHPAGDEAPARRLPGLDLLDHWLSTTVELAVAALVVAEIFILLAGVLARYVFRAPLLWSDELASVLFLWLAVLGAVVSFRRAQHLRMTWFVRKASARTQRVLETLAVTAPLAFLAAVLPASLEHASGDWLVTTSALGISEAWRAGAMPAGVALMLVGALIRLARQATLFSFAASAAILAALAGLMVALAPLAPSLGAWNLLLYFVVLTATSVFAGIPIAFSFASATAAYVWFVIDFPLTIAVSRMQEGMSHLILLAVPLFVLLGYLMEMTGIGEVIVRFLIALLGHVRGGLSYVLVAAMYLVSGISGAKAADMAIVAPILFPEMKKRGAPPGDLGALLAATAAQTETIPPSLVLITIGSVTGVSIQALFTGGLLPGALLAVVLCLMVWRRYRHDDLSQVRRAGLREIVRALVVAFPALLLPFVIRAAVVGGVTTATEVSTVGIVYAALAGLFVYRQWDWRRLIPMLVQSASLSGTILLIIGAATAMAWPLTQSGFSNTLAELMSGLPGGRGAFLAVSVVAFVILGSMLEGIPSIVLFGPLLFPVAAQLGVNEVHYAIVVILAMGLGLHAPPFGIGFYMTCAIGKVNPDEVMKPIWGYMLALLIGIFVLAAVPWFSTGFL
jgi:tripartite ATP-independent transporter DctM subunit